VELTKVLILSAHPDDMEMNMGGTVIKMKEKGWQIEQVVFSDCVELKGHQFIDGAQISINHLDVKTLFENYPNQEFPQHQSQIREFLYSLKQQNYDIIFVPCRQDWHQDHQILTRFAIAIFREKTILGYIKEEIFERHHDLRVDLTPEHAAKRVEIMRLFEQDVPPRTTEWFEVIQMRHWI